MGRVIIGMDPHKGSPTIEIIDEREQALHRGRLPLVVRAIGRCWRWGVNTTSGLGPSKDVRASIGTWPSGWSPITYLKVEWHHDFPDEPIRLYSELDDERYERRKVEVFHDRRHTFAGTEGFSGNTMLGEIPTPSLGEHAATGEFTATEIPQEEFEVVWP